MLKSLSTELSEYLPCDLPIKMYSIRDLRAARSASDMIGIELTVIRLLALDCARQAVNIY